MSRPRRVSRPYKPKRHRHEIIDPTKQTHLQIVARPRAIKVARAVVLALGQYGRLGTRAKALAAEIPYPYRTIQRALHRLSEIGEVMRVPGGWAATSVYHDVSIDPTATVGFQNLRVVVSNWVVPSSGTTKTWHQVSGGASGIVEASELAWEGRRVTLRYHPSTRTLEVIIAAIVPIPLDRAGQLYGWLTGVLGLDGTEDARITFVEINADHKALRLAENYIELRQFPGLAQVLYQKRRQGEIWVRHENRMSSPVDDDGKPISLREGIKQLQEGSPEARYERILQLELELSVKELELTRERAKVAPAESAPVRRSDVTPDQARNEGFG